MVVIDGKRWLCDVGFGVPLFPTPLNLDTVGPSREGPQGLSAEEHRWDDLFGVAAGGKQGHRHGDWAEIYKFTLELRCFEDFFQMCQYHQTSPCSLFFCKSLCMLFKSNSKVYIGRKLTTTKFPDGPVGEVEITTRELKDEVPGILAETFGIVLKSPLIVKDEGIAPPEVFY